jgi:hypothetical protein
MDAPAKPRKTRRSRSLRRSAKSAEPSLLNPDTALVQQLAAELRRGGSNAERLRTVLRAAMAERRGLNFAEMLSMGPDVSGPEFDQIFDEIERLRRDPVMTRVRDLDL